MQFLHSISGDTGLAKLLGSQSRHHLPAIVVGEYRYGLLRSRHRQPLEILLETLVDESTVLSIDEETATAYAVLRNDFRELGRPIPENDVWIAALAIQHTLAVVTRDGHFGYVPGLSRLDW